MPRKLPWNSGSATAAGVHKRSPANRTSVQKQSRTKNTTSKVAAGTTENDLPTSSPPGLPSVDSLMKEGIEHDDKYRMVEDEFLTIAKRFTMHLHAAEYKRQQREAKSRNAETINSISRPVVGKMPEHTKRKVDAVALAKTQRTATGGLPVLKSDHSDDSDDSAELPYVGTTLHGLMDSPRKKAASLAKFGNFTTTTRAAAGFKRPTTSSSDRTWNSPQAKKLSENIIKDENTAPGTSSEDDIDLSRPTRMQKLIAPFRKSAVTQSTKVKSETTSSSSIQLIPTRDLELTRETAMDLRVPKVEDIKPKLEDIKPNVGEFTSRRFRLQQAQKRRAKEEEERKTLDKYSVIPTFL